MIRAQHPPAAPAAATACTRRRHAAPAATACTRRRHAAPAATACTRRRHAALAAALAACLLVLTACAPGAPDDDAPEQPGSGEPHEQAADGPDDADEDRDPPPDPAEVGADELGVIPVLMYHRVVPGGGGDYDRSPEGFRAELERLAEEGYSPVRLDEVIDGRVDVPAGRTPVVLTFDDASPSQVAFADGPDGPAGERAIDPDTAVGILLDVAEAHDGFEATGSFYVIDALFGSEHGEELLRELHARGFELGNHTAGHVNLAGVGEQRAVEELAAGKRLITAAVPDATVRTLSLPFGVWPDDEQVAVRGEATLDGQTVAYEHDGILLVGANPSPSPFHADFDPLAVPRIHSQASDGSEHDLRSEHWLDHLAEHPDRRYVADGDPERISFPADRADELDAAFDDRANPYQPRP